MSDGMRRPPRIWEQKLEAMIKGTRTGFGAASTSPVIGAPTPGPGGPGEDAVEPPVLDPPEGDAPRKPASPSVFAAIGGLSILWTGLDSAGVPLPARSRVQVHVSTTTGFTPAEGTLRGLLAPGERLVLTDLTSGVTHFVRFVLVAPDGSVGEASDQVSAVAGFVLSTNIGTGTIEADMVSFDATAIGGIQQFVGTTAPPITGSGATQQPKNGSTWINTTEGSYYTLTAGAWVKRQWDSAAIAPSAISTLQIATGAITADSAIIASAAIGSANIIDGNITNAKIQSLSADKLTAGTIDAGVITVNNLDAAKITTGTLTGRTISGGTVTGATIQTRASGLRVILTNQDAVQWLSNDTLFAEGVATGFTGTAGTSVNGLGIFGAVANQGGLYVDGDIRVARMTAEGAAADFPGVVANAGATTGDAGFNGNRLRQKSSTQRLKYDITEVAAPLEHIDEARTSDVATVNPLNVLDVGVAEFTWIEDGEGTEWRELGFIAEDVHAKFPIAVGLDSDGAPYNVRDTPMIAALLAVVKDLTARIEALEA